MTIFPIDHPRPSRSVPAWLTAAGGRTTALLAGLVLANALAWAWAFALYADRPAIVGTAMLAWLLGLRHAVDADHIAAIDNVVRKLVQDGDAPRAAGLYFALGHSSVVVIATILVSLVAGADLLSEDSAIRAIGGAIGTSVSAGFLLLIALANLILFVNLWRRPADSQIDKEGAGNAGRGILIRLLRPVLRIVSRAWHMYPLGFLFGLGFDTASEIGLLSLSATEAARGASLAHVLVFPALFAAAMATVDTADSMLMVGAYRWALTDPARKRRYNLVITGASVAIAVVIGGIEAVSLLAPRLGFGSIGLGDEVGNLGIVVVGLFGLIWAGAMLIGRRRRGAEDAPGEALASIRAGALNPVAQRGPAHGAG
ncbi:hydrogenase nickel incorporation protein HupN [Bradyrhizobium sp. SSBR45G]|uniref:HoxN/HupN/NixA family nickel/cobalt transporter n=1 Tax=unclassified Bradyrhizobium TaxID=2631580 RepID=UPI002342A675|nr:MULTISPECIES: HoxN/HupN/NixA family nickel/cobalt transporter [unclassified Bradyrhizobium]GLH82195.1 hydrogenase nickel incorporation protein HupN [Bradyrhizobium sp. SSBR45G]GLH89628.1 hydrogenase nickel incorporation protein HupN [Bradyrhizobium sp. SSBR45R]